jgi:hypothetical protein
MSNAGQSTPGKSRTCPHCKATILASARYCPACRHHLQSDPFKTQSALPSFSPLRVEGTIRHPVVGEPWEYSVTVTIRNDRGEEIARQIIGVGALQPNEQRSFTVAVEVFTPAAAETAKTVKTR